MILALNTALIADGDLAAVPPRAAELGYAAVEVHLPSPGGENPAAGSIVADRDLVHLAFERSGITLSGLSAALSFADGGNDPAPDAVRRVIDLAARLRCPRVRVLDVRIGPGTNHAAAILRFADQLLPLADHAADAGVSLLIQNAISLRSAVAMWRLLEQADHPSLGCAWDPLASMTIGEDPMVAIPTLNKRIQQVQLRDATMTDGGGSSRAARRVVSLQRLGQGELDLRRSIDRLRGIGFAGPAVVSYPVDLPPDVGPAGDLLSQAVKTWKAWAPAPPKPAKAIKATA